MTRIVTLSGGIQVGVDGIEIESVSAYSPLIANNGYIRTTGSLEQFAQKSYYDALNELWLTTSVSGGSVTHDQNRKVKVLNVGTDATAKVIQQTKQAFTYLPGSTHRYTAGVNPKLAVGAGCRFGTFDGSNGYCFQLHRTSSGYECSVVRQTSVTGTLEEEVVPQSQWNLDKLDGTGPSGITLDWTKVQMPLIEYTWYGAGGAIYGFEIDRQYVFVHWCAAGNRLSEFIHGDPDLPIRYELYNNETTSESSTIALGGIFLAVDRGELERIGFSRGVLTDSVSVNNGNSYPLLSVRPRATFKGLTNKAKIVAIDFELFGTASGNYRIVSGATLTGGTWNDVDTNNSVVEYNETMTGITGGVVIYVGGFYTGNTRGGGKKDNLVTRDPLIANSDGSGGNNSYTIVFDATGNGNIGTSMNWTELY